MQINMQHKILLLGNLQVSSSKNDPQPKMVLIHQNLTFSTTAITITWRALNDKRCAYYQLVSQNCDLNSNTMVLINRTEEKATTLEPEILSNLTYFNLTVYDEGGQQCEELYLESFKFGPECKFIP